MHPKKIPFFLQRRGRVLPQGYCIGGISGGELFAKLGFDKGADRNSVTVSMPNDQMLSTKRGFLFFRSYPIVEPGSIITLRMKPPKTPEEEAKKTDWDAVFSRTASGLTSALTLYLLVNQLTK